MHTYNYSNIERLDKAIAKIKKKCFFASVYRSTFYMMHSTRDDDLDKFGYHCQNMNSRGNSAESRPAPILERLSL